MTLTETFLAAMALVFTVPFLVWRYGRTDYYAPLVVVQIITGVILGPGVMGRLWPGLYDAVFPAPVIQTLNGIALWGVMGFVFVAGVELDLSQAWRHRRESGIAASLALGVPFVFGATAAMLMPLLPGDWPGPSASPWQFVLAVGMSCAVTSLPILILLMDKLGILRQPLGQRILRYASLDDVAIWAVLAVILTEWQRVGLQLAFLAVFVVAGVLFRRFMASIAERDRWYWALAWLIVCALGADRTGLHYMVGAFLAGAFLDSHWFTGAHMDRFRHDVLLFAMPVYFLTTGLRTNWTVGGANVFVTAGLLLAAAVGGKLAGLHIAGHILGWTRAESTIVGWLLQTKALIGIVFTTVLLDKQLITSETFTALLLMAIASTMLTTPIVTPMLARYGAAARDSESARPDQLTRSR